MEHRCATPGSSRVRTGRGNVAIEVGHRPGSPSWVQRRKAENAVSVQTENPTFEKTYAEVQQFYARHIQLLDAGMVAEVALTFTEDAALLSPPKITKPIRGRADLVAGLQKAANALAEEGEMYRRCYTMIAVEQRPGAELHVRSYVQVIATRVTGEARLHGMFVCEDVLVREDGQLKVRERCVTRDDVR